MNSDSPYQDGDHIRMEAMDKDFTKRAMVNSDNKDLDPEIRDLANKNFKKLLWNSDSVEAILHEFGIYYPIATREERQKGIAEAKTALLALLEAEAENTGNGFLVVRLDKIKELFDAKDR